MPARPPIFQIGATAPQAWKCDKYEAVMEFWLKRAQEQNNDLSIDREFDKRKMPLVQIRGV